jgi:hypothetical protein
MAEEKLLDRLYGLPLEGFVAARDEAARLLRREGRAEAAARVGELRKPTVSAWAVNQLARRYTDRLGELLERGDRLRAAHRAALAGRGGSGLAAAGRAERQVVTELVRLAVDELEAAGRSASQAVRERIADTLHAAATDPDAAKVVRSGHLARDLDPSGFGDLGLVSVDEAEPNGEQAGRQDRQAFRRARDEARKQAAVAADRAIMAKREAERLRTAATRAEEAAARARAAADAATEAERKASELAGRSADALAEAEAQLAKV